MNLTDHPKGTGNRTQHQLELEIENMGGHLNAYTSVRIPMLLAATRLTTPSARTLFTTQSHSTTTSQRQSTSSQTFSRILNSNPPQSNGERDVILREQEEVDKQLEEVVFDHLHATAYMNQPLGRTILGPRENILSIQRQDLVDYISTNYTADRMVLVSAVGHPT